MSLRTKLILSYVAVILLTLLIVGAGLLLALRNYGQQLTALRLADAIGPTAVQARALWRQGSTPGQIATEIQDQLGNADWRVLIVNDAGQILADSSGDLTGRRLRQNFNPPPKPLQRAFTGRQVFTGRTLLYIGIVIGERDGSRAFILLASFVRPFLTTFAELIPLLAIGGGAALIVSILIALLLARSISQPLARLTRATEQVARGNYAQTIAAEGTDEVGRLAASFSTMAQAVQASQKMQKDFVANVSHELKTPLTSIQGFAQAILDGAVHDLEGARRAARAIYEEAARMTRLAGDLLTLARLETGEVPLNRTRVELDTLVRSACQRVSASAAAAGVRLAVQTDSTPPVLADAGRIEQVVVNLVDNAVKYNRPGGSVTVSTEMVSKPKDAERSSILRRRASHPPEARWVVIRVADTGPGIALEHLPRLFERFYRADQARVAGGTGLGLAIAQEIAHAHGGRIEVASEVGRGSTFSVWLPV